MRILIAVAVAFLASTAGAQTRPVFLEELTWPELKDAMAAGVTTAIIATGGIEQNGPHMTLVKHNLIARHVAEGAARQIGNTVVYPIVPFSMAGDPIEKTNHMRLPGTISLSSEIYMGLVRQVAISAMSAGFKHIFLMGDHGGGQAELQLAAQGLDADWRARGVRVHYLSNAGANQQSAAYMKEKGIAPGGHAGVAETSQMLFLGQGPRHVRPDKFAVTAAGPDASTGAPPFNPATATADMGKLFLDQKINDAVAQMRKALAAK
jgi:creatinine amidohydrolase/Fe(II)-dependent formamide hydrolase-like protein